MVNSRNVNVSGLIFGMNSCLYQVLPLALVRSLHVAKPARNGMPR